MKLIDTKINIKRIQDMFQITRRELGEDVGGGST